MALSFSSFLTLSAQEKQEEARSGSGLVHVCPDRNRSAGHFEAGVPIFSRRGDADQQADNCRRGPTSCRQPQITSEIKGWRGARCSATRALLFHLKGNKRLC